MLATVQRILPPGAKKFLHGTSCYALSSKGEKDSGKIGVVAVRHGVRGAIKIGRIRWFLVPGTTAKLFPQKFSETSVQQSDDDGLSTKTAGSVYVQRRREGENPDWNLWLRSAELHV